MISSRMVQPQAGRQRLFLISHVKLRALQRKAGRGVGLTTKYCNALFGISLFCSNADMNLLLGLSPVLISGYDTVNSRPRRWDVGSRILIILYPTHQPLSIRFIQGTILEFN